MERERKKERETPFETRPKQWSRRRSDQAFEKLPQPAEDNFKNDEKIKK